MQYSELVLLSVAAICTMVIPHIVTILLLRKLKFRSLTSLSLLECLLIAISISELEIILPSFLFGIASVINLRTIFYCMAAGNVSLSLYVILRAVTRQQLRMNYFSSFLRVQSKKPAFIVLGLLLVFYGYLLLIVPVDLSFDAINYYLPYAKGLLDLGKIPSSPLQSYFSFGGQPAIPPGPPLVYAFSLNFGPTVDAFKLIPLVFLAHLVIVSSLIGKIVLPTIKLLWIAIILLVMPPIFIYMVTTPYNGDLLFYAIYLSAIYCILKCKIDRNIIWSLLAGACLSGTILVRDIGIAYSLPLISMLLLGNGKYMRFWVVPLILLIGVPLSYILNAKLFSVYYLHSAALITIQVAIILGLLLMSRRLVFNFSVRVKPFILTALPGAIFVLWSFGVWGSPIIRTQVGLLSSLTTIDYQWATTLAFNQLGVGALPIFPQSFEGMYMNLAQLFIAPILGSLFLVPKLIALRTMISRKSHLYTILFLITIFVWLTIFGGLYYQDWSTFRHLLDVSVPLAMLIALGYVYLFSNLSSGEIEVIITISVSIIFMINILTYFNYNSTLFSLPSRVFTEEPLVKFIVVSVMLHIILYIIGHSQKFKNKKIQKGAVISGFLILLIAILPIIGSTLTTINSLGYSYEKTYRYSLSTIIWYPKILNVIDYFSSQPPSGNILAYGIDSLDYRSGWNVLELRAIINMAILKNLLDEKDPLKVYQQLKAYNVKYIVVPIYGDSGKRFMALYGATEFIKFLKTSFVQPLIRHQNILIYKLI